MQKEWEGKEGGQSENNFGLRSSHLWSFVNIFQRVWFEPWGSTGTFCHFILPDWQLKWKWKPEEKGWRQLTVSWKRPYLEQAKVLFCWWEFEARNILVATAAAVVTFCDHQWTENTYLPSIFVWHRDTTIATHALYNNELICWGLASSFPLPLYLEAVPAGNVKNREGMSLRHWARWGGVSWLWVTKPFCEDEFTLQIRSVL